MPMVAVITGNHAVSHTEMKSQVACDRLCTQFKEVEAVSEAVVVVVRLLAAAEVR